jgi:DNA repair exonuclease SbcCD ATPase subunit
MLMPSMAQFEQDTKPQEELRTLQERKKKKEEELKKLEDEKKKELAEAEAAIRNQEERLQSQRAQKERDEREHARLQELQEKRQELEQELAELQTTSLEGIVAQEPKPQEAPPQLDYFIERLRGEEVPLYAVTNYQVYNQLQDIRNKVAQGEYLNDQEQLFLDSAAQQAERFKGDTDYLEVKDPFEYIMRTEDLLQQINSYVNLSKQKSTIDRPRTGHL